MCGLAGAILSGDDAAELTRQAVGDMCDWMRERGPDAVGYWSDKQVATTLGLRRLAIIDLDRRADQPMHDENGRFVIVYNGEIYNYRDLRNDLQSAGEVFRTTSDTEVVLKLYAREGAAMLAKLRGMYAFAIWDTVEKSAFLARDPYGIKPLYIAKTKRGALFASQVRALRSTGLVGSDPDPLGRAGFWLLGSVPDPHTWFADITAVPPGWHARITSLGQVELKEHLDLSPFWHSADPVVRPQCAREIVRDALRLSVQAHLVADVPVGIFLSGGVDSGALAGLMVEAGSRDLQAVTLAFNEFEGKIEDEAPTARLIAKHYGIRHAVRQVTRREFEDDLPRILRAMDQPTVDGINTWFASKAIAELGLKVVVSGVGGDELFQGYSTFQSLPKAVRAWRGISTLPGTTRLARLLFKYWARRAQNPRWELVPDLMRSMEGAWFVRRGLFAPTELPGLMGSELADAALKCLHPVAMVQEITGPLPADLSLKLSQIESLGYLRNQLLRDSDWASMAHSVELRTPLVDSALLGQVAPVIGALKRFGHKQLLAESPKRPIPADVVVRRKTGFGIPVQSWLTELGLARGTEGMSRGWARVLADRIYAPA